GQAPAPAVLTEGRAPRPRLSRREPQPGPLLPDGARLPRRAGRHRQGGVAGHARAPADHARQAPGRLHPPGKAEATRLHGGLGPPQAERPGSANGALQGPVPGGGRTGRGAHRPHVSRTPGAGGPAYERERREPAAIRPASTPAAPAARKNAGSSAAVRPIDRATTPRSANSSSAGRPSTSTSW